MKPEAIIFALGSVSTNNNNLMLHSWAGKKLQRDEFLIYRVHLEAARQLIIPGSFTGTALHRMVSISCSFIYSIINIWCSSYRISSFSSRLLKCLHCFLLSFIPFFLRKPSSLISSSFLFLAFLPNDQFPPCLFPFFLP